MKRIVIEFEELLHKQIKMKALRKDVTIKQYVTDLIIQDLKTEANHEYLIEKG